jgi:RNA polymerase sigma factor (sigma-70 family)
VKEFTDIEIIECLKRRESYVVRYLSENYMPMIRLMVLQNGGDNDDAQDIFQDGLIIMLEKIDSGDFTLTCKFKTYLYCVCENLWKSVLNKRKSAQNYFARREESDIEKDFSEQMDRNIYEDIFRDVFNSLDQGSRSILQMYWQNIPPQKIAEKLGFTYGYVRKKKCEAQNEMAERVRQHPEYRRIMKAENVVVRDAVI